ISGVRLVKAFAREKYEAHKFLEQNKEYYNLNIKQMKIWSRFFPTIEFIYNLLIVFVIVIGGAFVIGEELTLGTLVRFSQYTYMVIWPMRLLGWLSSLMAEAGASVKKINLIFDEKPVIESKEDAIVKEHLSGNVEFDQVGLSFDKKQVLKDISFTIKPGKSLAIMGAAGSGKSLIVSLLCRFCDSTEGHITIDGIDVKDLDLGCLRSNISMVMQDTFLFSDTIEENIKLGGKDYITPEIMAVAAENAQAHDFISLMEQSYETVIGEKGVGLSGGQKQRISMARAFAKNAPILVFDDSTSALDLETEKQVQQAISDMNGITTIVIAHRISAVMNADEIIVLDDGEVVERGTHITLLNQKGSYYETYVEQYEGYEVYDAYKKEQVG
ncbi:MAG: ABC transporter ATP-binding protein, partial [Vallitaleaceae bacterium]|nr:ABC transporter ATP-binding protein [Vallitaleaceae bacterium]